MKLPLVYLQTLGHLGRIILSVHTSQRASSAGPLYVQIGISNRCNYRCVMCWDHPSPSGSGTFYPDETARRYYQEHSDVDRDSALMDVSLFQVLVDDLHRMGTRRIKLIGRGEPLINPACPEMVDYAKSRRMSCSLTTNGSLLDTEMVGRFLRAGLDDIEISLNAAREETYERIHAGSRGMATVLSGIRALASAKAERGSKTPRLVLSFAIHALNWQEIEGMITLSAELGADEVSFRQTRFFPAIDSLRLEQEAILELKGSLKRAARLARSRGLKTNIQALFPSLPQLAMDYRRDATLEDPCYAGWYFCLILADGTTSPCCQCMGTMGNLRERSFPEIWKSPVYRQFREEARMIPSRGRALEGCRCYDCALLPHNLAFHQALFFYRPLNVLRFLWSDRQRRWKDLQKF